MTLRMNQELADILNAVTPKTQYAQVRALEAALGANRRIKAKQHANAATLQSDVWATGTLFRDAALTGAFTYNGAEITKFGVTSDLTTCLAADLTIGISVIRIEGNGHWIEDTFGLSRAAQTALGIASGQQKDFAFTFPTQPTATNSFALAGTFRIKPNKTLPDGTPDTTKPVASVSLSASSMSEAGSYIVTGNVSDNIGVTKVEFLRDSVLVKTLTQAPWTHTDSVTFQDNGSVSWKVRATDAAGNVTLSAATAMAVNIPIPIETGPATAVGAELTTITLQNTSNAVQANVPVTFGQVFKVGALPAANAGVTLKAPDNSTVPCQLDVKATYADGSVKHAILSALIPSHAVGSTTYSIVRAAAPLAGTAAVPADFAGLNATVTLAMTGTNASGPVAGTTYTADASALLAAGTYDTWLSGPVCSEWILNVPLKDGNGNTHPDLVAFAHIRAYKGQAKAKVDFVIENNTVKLKAAPSGSSPWDETVGVTDYIYVPTLKISNTTVYSRANKGYHITKLSDTVGIYDNNPTGLANNSTVYNATVTVDGVAKAISITGSAAQNYGQLKSLLNTQLGGMATCASDYTNLGLQITSATSGPNSSVVISYGTLWPALGHMTPYRPMRGDEAIHYARTRWKKTFWWNNSEPALHVVHNKIYMMATKAVPNYEPGLVGSASEIARVLALLKANEDIGQNGISKAYMGDVGFAPGIGILPEWCAMYLASQDKDAKYIMLKQADLSGSWPSHFRVQSTGRAVNFQSWPYATISPNAGDSFNSATGLQEKLPVNQVTSTLPLNINIPDVAHHPDQCFLPYMVTGDYYYMEGMVFYSRFVVLLQNAHANFRDGKKGLLKAEQVRAQGWGMRTLVHAHYLLPDNHPLRTDVAYQIEQNRLWYLNNCVSPEGVHHNALGVTVNGYAIGYPVKGNINTGVAPWQDDFFTSAMGRAVELGYVEFLPVLRYKSRFVTARLTSGSDFCWRLAASYTMRIRNTETSPFYTTIREVYEGTFDNATVAAPCDSQTMTDILKVQEGGRSQPNTMTGYPDLIGGYPANMQPGLAYCATFDMPNADNAWMVYDARSLKPDYNLGPQFGIIPRN